MTRQSVTGSPRQFDRRALKGRSFLTKGGILSAGSDNSVVTAQLEAHEARGLT